MGSAHGIRERGRRLCDAGFSPGRGNRNHSHGCSAYRNGSSANESRWSYSLHTDCAGCFRDIRTGASDRAVYTNPGPADIATAAAANFDTRTTSTARSSGDFPDQLGAADVQRPQR